MKILGSQPIELSVSGKEPGTIKITDKILLQVWKVCFSFARNN
jgi:hypothetical protein